MSEQVCSLKHILLPGPQSWIFTECH